MASRARSSSSGRRGRRRSSQGRRVASDDACVVCASGFRSSLFGPATPRSAHTCRQCGGVVCDGCGDHRKKLVHLVADDLLHRVCSTCKDLPSRLAPDCLLPHVDLILLVWSSVDAAAVMKHMSPLPRLGVSNVLHLVPSNDWDPAFNLNTYVGMLAGVPALLASVPREAGPAAQLQQLTRGLIARWHPRALVSVSAAVPIDQSLPPCHVVVADALVDGRASTSPAYRSSSLPLHTSPLHAMFAGSTTARSTSFGPIVSSYATSQDTKAGAVAGKSRASAAAPIRPYCGVQFDVLAALAPAEVHDVAALVICSMLAPTSPASARTTAVLDVAVSMLERTIASASAPVLTSLPRPILGSPPVLPPSLRADVTAKPSDALPTLRHLLHRRGPPGNLVVVQDPPGVGKTIHVANVLRSTQLRSMFSDGVYWLRLHDDLPDSEVLAQQRLLLSSLSDGVSPQERLERAITLADAQAELKAALLQRKVLIVVDGVQSVSRIDAIRSLVGRNGRMLWTTSVTDLGAAVCCVAVPRLAPPAACALITQLGVSRNHRDMPTILAASKQHPLSMRILGMLSACGARVSAASRPSSLRRGASPSAKAGTGAAATAISGTGQEHGGVDLIASAVRAALQHVSSLISDAELRFQQLAVFPAEAPIPVDAAALLWRQRNANTLDILGVYARVGLLDLSLPIGEFSVPASIAALLRANVPAAKLAGWHRDLVAAFAASVPRADNWGSAPLPRLAGYMGRCLVTQHAIPGNIADQAVQNAAFRLAWLRKRVAPPLGDPALLLSDLTALESAVPSKDIVHLRRVVQHMLARLFDPDVQDRLAAHLLLHLDDSDPSGRPLCVRLARECHADLASMSVLAPSHAPLALPVSPIWTFDRHADRVQAVAIVPAAAAAARRAVSVSVDGQAYVLGLDSRKCLAHLALPADAQPGPLTGVATYTNAAGVAIAAVATSGPLVHRFRLDTYDLVDTLTCSAGRITAIAAISADDDVRSALVLAGTSEHFVHVWDASTAKLVTTLIGHTGGVSCLAVCSLPQLGAVLVSGSDDKSLRVAHVPSGKPTRRLLGHRAPVTCVSVHVPTKDPAAAIAVSGSDDKTLRVWSLADGECRSVIAAHFLWLSSVALLPDPTGSGDVWSVSGCSTPVLRVTNITTGRPVGTMTLHEASVQSVAVDAAGGFIVSGSWDNTVQLASMADLLARPRRLHFSGVHCLTTVQRDGKSAPLLLTGSDDNTVAVLRLPSRTCVAVLRGHTDTITGVAAFPPDAETGTEDVTVVTASHDATLRVWSLASGACEGVMTGHHGWITCMTSYVDARGSKKAYTITGSSDNSLRVWDVTRRDHRYVMYGHTGWVSAVTTYMPSGSKHEHHAVSASRDKSIRLWDLCTGTALHVIGSASAPIHALVCCTIRGATVAIVGTKTGRLESWKTKSRTRSIAARAHSQRVSCAETLGSGLLLTGGYDGRLRVWNLSQGRLLQTLDLGAAVTCMQVREQDVLVGFLDGAVASIRRDPHAVVMHTPRISL